MRCFDHEERDAVGLCKNCSKGLCRECAAEVGGSLACRSRCEAAVQQLNTMINLTLRHSSTAARFPVMFWFYAALAAVMLITGVVGIGGEVWMLGLALGVVFATLAAYLMLHHRKFHTRP